MRYHDTRTIVGDIRRLPPTQKRISCKRNVRKKPLPETSGSSAPTISGRAPAIRDVWGSGGGGRRFQFRDVRHRLPETQNLPAAPPNWPYQVCDSRAVHHRHICRYRKSDTRNSKSSGLLKRFGSVGYQRGSQTLSATTKNRYLSYLGFHFR